jgi:single-strand DNA-binding protein
MNDTYVTVVGTALTTPEWKKIAKTDAVVANFRIVSHSRRYDRVNEQWVDGPNLRIRVNCWRRLAEGVCASIIAGDPVVVYGRIATREWKTEQGEARLSYEVEAQTVGHDLSRGQSRFERKKAEPAGTVVEDADSEARVNGELAYALSGSGAADDHATDEAFDDFSVDGGALVTDLDAMAILQSLQPEGEGEEETDEEEVGEAHAGSGGSGGRGRRRGRAPVPA